MKDKIEALEHFCAEQEKCQGCPLENKLCCFDSLNEKELNRVYDFAFPKTEEKSGFQEAMEKIQECGIKDSGNRREFNTGAVRDIQEGKGRCDLLPLRVCVDYASTIQDTAKCVLVAIEQFILKNDIVYLRVSLDYFRKLCGWDDLTMFLEVSKHFEEGAKKYGERNWEKGIPTHCYVDSAVRHYLKWLRGDTDEPHDRAFCWNILCCIWTCQNMPELNDYPIKKEGVGG